MFADECYSEIYWKDAPPGMLEHAGSDFANVAVFHSLSKRSSLPGLRIGFVAGDKTFIKPFLDLRSVAAPQVPVPAQEVAIAAYNDETHVQENQALYRAKFDLADQIIGNRYGYKRPAGGFFLWLDVSAQGGSEAATLKLWKEAGLRVLPGKYAARDAGRRLQSGRKLHPHRDGAGPRGHRRGAASSCRLPGIIMPAVRYTFSAADLMSDELRAALRRRLHEIIGLVVLGLAGPRGARARHLVGAGSLAQPRHQCAGAQHARASAARSAPT